MKVFISVPMSGRTDKDVSIEIEQIKKIFMMYISDTNPGETVEFVDTYIQDDAPDICVTEPIWYLGESIKILSTCDAVLFAPGYHKARGCNIEHEVTKVYGLTFYNLQTDYNTKCRIAKHKYINGRLQSEPKWIRDL